MNPTDITLKRPPRWEGAIPTFSGRGFHPLDPRVNEVCIEDIARGLAYKFRYGGHCRAITVAEHSLVVGQIIRTLWPDSNKALAGLLHDACEAYTHDIQAPVRKFLKVELPSGVMISWGDMERRINQIVAKALNIDPNFYSAPEVRAADILAAALEKDQCDNLRPGNWGLPPIPAELSGMTLGFMDPEAAYTAFLQELQTELAMYKSRPTEF